MRTARATTSMTVRATATGLPSGSLTATRTEPTTAVSSEDPRLETLRDRPEISPWFRSGKLDWTTLTEEVSMVPTPRAEQQQSRDPPPDACARPDQDRQQDHADRG